MIPLILLTSFMYWSYIWKLAPIPSSSYPYVQMMWPLRALQNSVWYTGTMQGEVEHDPSSGTVSFQPSNLPDGNWWYWRARASADAHIDDHEQRTYGPWSRVGYLYTNFKSTEKPLVPPLPVDRSAPDISEALRLGLPSAPALRSPDDGSHADNPNPNLVVLAARDPEGRDLVYQFEVDQVPSFDGSFLQSSDDEPILFEAIKPVVIAIGLAVGLVSFVVLSVLGLPVLLIFGYIRSLTSIPHVMITEIIGALLARYYFWKRFGRQQWRLYAAVLYVGFSVGMSLVGMASVSIAMIQKAVSVLLF